MRPAATPFMITVCGLKELAGHADRKVSHIISILDPGEPEPEAFGTYSRHARLELKFHDIIEEKLGFQAPQSEHVDKILEFGRHVLGDPEDARHLLVHCHGGISRSTASIILLLAQAQPDVPASNLLAHVLHIRDKAWPNLRILEIGERQLGREGEFTTAVGEFYRHQLQRSPELLGFFLNSGRGREIELALSKMPKREYLSLVEEGRQARLASGNTSFYSWFLAAVLFFFLAVPGVIFFLTSSEDSNIYDREAIVLPSRVTSGGEGLPVSSLRGGDKAADAVPEMAIATVETKAAPVTQPSEGSSAAVSNSNEGAQSSPEVGSGQFNQATGGRTARLAPGSLETVPAQPDMVPIGREPRTLPANMRLPHREGSNPKIVLNGPGRTTAANDILTWVIRELGLSFAGRREREINRAKERKARSESVKAGAN